MADFANSESVILKNVRVTWLDIFAPGEASEGYVSKYKVSGLFDPAQTAVNPETGQQDIAFGPRAVATAAMLAAAKQLWPDNAAAVILAMDSKAKAIRKGDDQLDDNGNVKPGYAGMLYLSSANKTKPQIVGPKKFNGKFVTITEAGRGMVDGVDVTDQLGYELKKPYRGCYCNVKVQFTAGRGKTVMKGKEKVQLPNQIFAKIEAIQFVADGEAFGPGATSAEGFGEEAVEEGASGGADLF